MTSLTEPVATETKTPEREVECTICCVDVGITHLGIVKVSVFKRSEEEKAALKSCFTLDRVPDFRVDTWLNLNLNRNNNSRMLPEGAVKKLVTVFKTTKELKDILRTCDYFVIERQVGGKQGNPDIVSMSYVLQTLFLCMNVKRIPVDDVKFMSSGVKFTNFRKLGIEFAQHTKECSKHRKYTRNKQNAIQLVQEVLAHKGMDENLTFFNSHSFDHKKDYADSLGLALTFYIKHIAKVKFPRKPANKKRKTPK